MIPYCSSILSLFSILLWLLLPAQVAAQQPDSSSVDRRVSRLPAGHSPDGALWRSLAIPGWGQIYNRQYWKLPFVYAGIGGVATLAVRFGQQHRLYTRAYQWRAWEDQVGRGSTDTNPFPQYEDEYRKVLVELCGSCEDVSQQNLKQLRDNFRRNRDLSLFGIGLVYGLSTLDAFVSAHLLDFDVGEDLTVRLLPHPEGVTASIRIGL